MAVKTLYFKEHEEIVHNPIGQLLAMPSMPWWNAFGSQSSYGESCALFKPSSMEQPPTGEDQLSSMKQARRAIEQGIDKGNITQFTIFPGDCKSLGDGQKSPQTAISLQTSLPEYHAHIDQGFGQPMIYAKYPGMDGSYGVFSTYGPQVLGRIMLPMNMTTDDGPIFVNPKQYHGIIRRRKTRAKAVLLENKSTRNRKPYMHFSRHLHAMRRPRGTGGRFLNTKTSDNGIGKTEAMKAGDAKISKSTGSQSSEVVQLDSGTLNSSTEANGGGSSLSGSEVTSMYTRRDLDYFSINFLASQVPSFSLVMDSGHNNVMPTKWVAAADDCCNLKV